MTDREDEIEAAARKLAEDKAQLDKLGERTDDLEREIGNSEPPLNQGWKGDVA
jgi:hypothetical protein